MKRLLKTSAAKYKMFAWQDSSAKRYRRVQPAPKQPVPHVTQPGRLSVRVKKQEESTTSAVGSHYHQ